MVQLGQQKRREFTDGKITFRQEVGGQWGGIRDNRAFGFAGPTVLLERDSVFYAGKYVGWVDYQLCTPIIMDRAVADVIAKQIEDAAYARDIAYRIPPLRRRCMFTLTSGYY